MSFRDMTSLKTTNYSSLMIMGYIVTVDMKIVIGQIPCDHKKGLFSQNEVIFSVKENDSEAELQWKWRHQPNHCTALATGAFPEVVTMQVNSWGDLGETYIWKSSGTYCFSHLDVSALNFEEQALLAPHPCMWIGCVDTYTAKVCLTVC